MIAISFVISAIIIFFAIVILTGKGDGLMAGYNTASEEKRKKVNIKRLRLLTAAVLFLTSIFLTATAFINNKEVIGVAVLIFIIILIVFVILANTWAKKK